MGDLRGVVGHLAFVGRHVGDERVVDPLDPEVKVDVVHVRTCAVLGVFYPSEDYPLFLRSFLLSFCIFTLISQMGLNFFRSGDRLIEPSRWFFTSVEKPFHIVAALSCPMLNS